MPSTDVTLVNPAGSADATPPARLATNNSAIDPIARRNAAGKRRRIIYFGTAAYAAMPWLTSAIADSGPSQPFTETHLPSSRSL